MKEAIVSKGPTVKIEDTPIPKPGPDQVLIKVIVSGSNPKDWYAISPLLTLQGVRATNALRKYPEWFVPYLYLPSRQTDRGQFLTELQGE